MAVERTVHVTVTVGQNGVSVVTVVDTQQDREARVKICEDAGADVGIGKRVIWEEGMCVCKAEHVLQWVVHEGNRARPIWHIPHAHRDAGVVADSAYGLTFRVGNLRCRHKRHVRPIVRTALHGHIDFLHIKIDVTQERLGCNRVRGVKMVAHQLCHGRSNAAATPVVCGVVVVSRFPVRVQLVPFRLHKRRHAHVVYP